MATDREVLENNVRVITRITYFMDENDLMKRTVVKIKDVDDAVHVISRETVNVGEKSDFKQMLRDERGKVKDIIKPFQDQVDFINEQIDDINLL